MNESPEMLIVYDGDCPFCARYVRMLRLQAAVGPVRLVNARDDHPSVDRLRTEGYDLNEGMALIDGEDIHFGDDCMHRLALMSTGSGLFNRINATIFRHRALARVLYPILRTGRNATLRVLGRQPI